MEEFGGALFSLKPSLDLQALTHWRNGEPENEYNQGKRYFDQILRQRELALEHAEQIPSSAAFFHALGVLHKAAQQNKISLDLDRALKRLLSFLSHGVPPEMVHDFLIAAQLAVQGHDVEAIQKQIHQEEIHFEADILIRLSGENYWLIEVKNGADFDKVVSAAEKIRGLRNQKFEGEGKIVRASLVFTQDFDQTEKQRLEDPGLAPPDFMDYTHVEL